MIPNTIPCIAEDVGNLVASFKFARMVAVLVICPSPCAVVLVLNSSGMQNTAENAGKLVHKTKFVQMENVSLPVPKRLLISALEAVSM